MSKKEIAFEEAMSSLEESIKKLESGELSLDDSLSEFEKSIALVKICQSKLDGAKQKVRILIEDANGSVTDAPFGAESDET